MKREYKSVGIIIISRDSDRIFMLHRVNRPITWSGLAGGMEKGETPVETIKREIKEEIGLDPNTIQNINVVGTSDTMGHTHYVTVGFVDTEFEVPNLLIEENDDYGWFDENNLPSPLHPGFMKSLNMVKNSLNLTENIIKIEVKKVLNEQKFNKR